MIGKGQLLTGKAVMTNIQTTTNISIEVYVDKIYRVKKIE